jgi:predicted NACHT family NTPase
MNNYQKDENQKMKINQSAIQDIEAGRDLTIGNITQVYSNPYLSNQKERYDKIFRSKLLNKVHQYWFQSLQNRRLAKIELILEERPDLVRNPFNYEEEACQSIQESNLDIICEQWTLGKRLLILGNAGSGKSIALLQLGKQFYHQAKDNILENPIPVVFHLSSWKYGQSISEWLISQLDSKYGFPLELGEIWVKNRSLFLLLDGLDELDVTYQLSCIQEINKFGASDIIVCCRTHQYESLLQNEKHLEMDQVVQIKPLDYGQINNYFANSNLKCNRS